MSKYTTEVRFICEELSGLDKSAGYANVNTILDNSWNKVFDFNFPIFDETYRPILCKKILKHYYTREIGFETIGLWKLKLDMMMNEIMPYYNQLYSSTLLEWNPLHDADYTREHDGFEKINGERVGTHTGTVREQDDLSITASGTYGKQGTENIDTDDDLTETSWDVYSDTPQGALTNVENNTYLTNARKVTHSSNRDIDTDRTYAQQDTESKTGRNIADNLRTYNEKQENEDDIQTTDEYVDHVVGKFPGKSYATLIKEFRETMLNIDVDVIAELSDLFLKLW